MAKNSNNAASTVKKIVKRRRRRSSIPVWMSLLMAFAAFCIALVLDMSGLVNIFGGGEREAHTVSGGTMEIHMIDVGQADCFLIMVPGCNLLFDAGEDKDASEVTSYLDGLGITKLDYVIFTHADKDHIGGGETVINKYEIGKVFIDPHESVEETKTFRELRETIVGKGIDIIDPLEGTTYSLGENGDLKMKVLGPVKDYRDKNDDSIVMRLDFGDTSLLMTGDAGEKAERDILEMFGRAELDCDILKVGHHGSSTSSCMEFLQAVTPEYALISSNKDDSNDFGHPHEETLSSLEAIGAQIYRTDTLGDVVIITDGTTITVVESEDTGTK